MALMLLDPLASRMGAGRPRPMSATVMCGVKLPGRRVGRRGG